jgi:hypothetical protein
MQKSKIHFEQISVALVKKIAEEDASDYLTVWLAVAFCAWYCGLGQVFRTFAGEVAICGC